MPNFSMAKRKPVGARAQIAARVNRRGPYKTKNDEDAGKFGTAGILIRQYRIAKGWTIDQVAEMADLSYGTISSIEAGKNGFSAETLIALASAFNTTIGALFDKNPLSSRTPRE